jgi:TPP-dependent pyruvate/acetoin dehydrogenase alpha subunit
MTDAPSQALGADSAFTPENVYSDPDIRRYIGDGGELEDVAPPEMPSTEQLVDILRNMIVLRVLDERIVAYQRQGRCGTNPTYFGEEAVMAVPALAAGPDDWLFPTYRQTVIGVIRGMDIALPILQFRGDNRGLWDPWPQRIGGVAHPIATHMPHAVGLPYAARLRGDDVAALAYIGDGGTSAGETHEAMNMAAVWNTATVFLCSNNQWAISTPLELQSANPRLFERAAGYKMPGVRVDGFDPLALQIVCAEAFARAHAGEGPTFIEAVTYRIGPHATPDDPTRYRSQDISEQWRRFEPIGRFRAWMERQGIYEDGMEEEMRTTARDAADDAMNRIEEEGEPPPEVMHLPLYARPPADLLEHFDAQQRNEA